MTTVRSVENVNIEKYPAEIAPADKDRHITVGDLHGNPIKLLHFLVRENVFKLSEDNYNYLVQLYNRDYSKIPPEDVASIQKQDFEAFKKILDSVVINPMAGVRLIGDFLADRGNNDYLNLLVLQKLVSTDVPVEIMISNHDMEFLIAYANRHFKSSLGKEQAKSLFALGDSIENGAVDIKEVVRLVENIYKPCLRAISYSVDKTKNPPDLTLYTHAPLVDKEIPETIIELAQKYGIEPKLDTIDNFTSTIDEINKCFLKEAIQKDGLEKEKEAFYGVNTNEPENVVEERTKAVDKSRPLPAGHPLFKIMWSRNTRNKPANLEFQPQNFNVKLAHGHVGPSDEVFHAINQPAKSLLPNMYNLDSMLGRPPKFGQNFSVGTYHLLNGNDTPAKKLKYEIPPKDHLLNISQEFQTQPSRAISMQKLNDYAKHVKETSQSKTSGGLLGVFGRGKEIHKMLAVDKLITLLKNPQANSQFSSEEVKAIRNCKANDPLKGIIQEMDKNKIMPRQFIEVENQPKETFRDKFRISKPTY